ncbi:MAG: hypothetical protein KAI44_05880 [Methylococcales bacterium]|nr:hypothetical protein [Methylococcales bacterium]MCK5478425.1 hypothetical protein [Methylococcales bacterium]
MNNGKINISNYKDLIFIDLFSHEKVTRMDIRWLSESLKQNFKRKRNVIALISGSYNLCSSATHLIEMQKHFIGDAVAFVVQSSDMKINDLYYAQFSCLKGKDIAYFNKVTDAYDWIKQKPVNVYSFYHNN